LKFWAGILLLIAVSVGCNSGSSSGSNSQSNSIGFLMTTGYPGVISITSTTLDPVKSIDENGLDCKQPDYCLATNTVVYSIFDGNHWQIKTHNFNTGTGAQLTNDSVDHYSPRFNPSGTKIVYVSEAPSHPSIYNMDADGGNQERLTNGSESNTSPSFNPAGTRIAYVSDQSGEKQIHVMDSDGANQTQISNELYEVASVEFGPTTGYLFYHELGGQQRLVTSYADGTGISYYSTNSFNVRLGDDEVFYWVEFLALTSELRKMSYTNGSITTVSEVEDLADVHRITYKP